jgi:hypothetical protein
MKYTYADIEAAHKRALQRQAELRRQIMDITGTTPLILPKGVITLEAEVIGRSKIQRRYHLISTGAYRAGKAWILARSHAARVDEMIRLYTSLPADAAPRTCLRCGEVLARSNRFAKYCSTKCQKQASNQAARDRKRAA